MGFTPPPWDEYKTKLGHDYYPYADTGYTWFTWLRRTLTVGLILTILGTIVWLIPDWFYITLITVATQIMNETWMTISPLFSNATPTPLISQPATSYVPSLTLWLPTIINTYLGFTAIPLTGYTLTLIARQRAYERHVLLSDLRSWLATRRLHATLQLSPMLNRVKTQRAKAEHYDADLEAEHDVLKTIKQAVLRIHVRQDLDQDEIITTYIYTIPLSPRRLIYDKMMQHTQIVESAINRSFRGKVVIGERLVSSAMDRLTWSTSQINEGEYERSLPKVPMKTVTDPPYQYTVDLTVLEGNRAEREEKTAKAQEWANQYVFHIDSILTTADKNAERKGVFTSASTITYRYSLPFKFLTGGHSDNAKKAIAQVFDIPLEQIVIKISGKSMDIIVPLPEEFRPPIDMAFMLRSTFGDDKPNTYQIPLNIT